MKSKKSFRYPKINSRNPFHLHSITPAAPLTQSTKTRTTPFYKVKSSFPELQFKIRKDLSEVQVFDIYKSANLLRSCGTTKHEYFAKKQETPQFSNSRIIMATSRGFDNKSISGQRTEDFRPSERKIYFPNLGHNRNNSSKEPPSNQENSRNTTKSAISLGLGVKGAAPGSAVKTYDIPIKGGLSLSNKPFGFPVYINKNPLAEQGKLLKSQHVRGRKELRSRHISKNYKDINLYSSRDLYFDNPFADKYNPQKLYSKAEGTCSVELNRGVQEFFDSRRQTNDFMGHIVSPKFQLQLNILDTFASK